jgi:antitoxin VapB
LIRDIQGTPLIANRGTGREQYIEVEVDRAVGMYLRVDMPATKTHAKLFKHGGSQAARLPREFRLPGTEAAISRTPTGGVLLEPLNADFEARRRRFFDLAGSCPDLLDVPTHSTPDIPRDE